MIAPATSTVSCRTAPLLQPVVACVLQPLPASHTLPPGHAITIGTAHIIVSVSVGVSCNAGMALNLPLSLFLDLVRRSKRRFTKVISRRQPVSAEPLYSPLLQYDSADDDEVCRRSKSPHPSSMHLAQHSIWYAHSTA